MKIYSFLRIIFILIQNLTHIPAYLFTTLVVLYPMYLCNSKLYWKLENYLYNFTLYTVASWSWCGKIKVHEYGDSLNDFLSRSDEEDKNDDQTNNNNVEENDETIKLSDSLKKKPKILFIANHQSTSDVPLLFAMFTCYWDRVLLWIMDKQFKYTNFGVVSWTHGDFFIQPGKFVPNELTNHCLKYPDKNCYILFPEGGFRYKKKQSSDRYSEKMGLCKLNYVTWPRIGAFKDLLDEQINISHIVDTTVLYPDLENTLSILDIFKGDKKADVHIIHRIFRVSEEKTNEEWLRKIWFEKEEIMKSFYEDKDLFLQKQNKLNNVNLSWKKIFWINILYLTLSCFYSVLFMFVFNVI